MYLHGGRPYPKSPNTNKMIATPQERLAMTSGIISGLR